MRAIFREFAFWAVSLEASLLGWAEGSAVLFQENIGMGIRPFFFDFFEEFNANQHGTTQ